jgi:Helix-turn-helix domain
MSDLGDMLRATREGKALSVAEVALETRIRGKIIVALEAGDLKQLPPEPFIRGLLKNYARFLGLEPDLVLDAYAIEAGLKQAPVSAPGTLEVNLPLESPIANDAPPVPERPAPDAMPALPQQLGQLHHSDSGNARVDVPSFVSRAPTFSQSLQGGPPASTRTGPAESPGPVGDHLEGNPSVNVPVGLTQPVFQIAPEVLPEPLPGSGQLATIRRFSGTKLPEAIAAIAVTVAVFAIAAFGYSRLHVTSTGTPQFAAFASTTTPTASPVQVTTSLPTPVPTFEAAAAVENAPPAATTPVVSTKPSVPLVDVPQDARMDIQVSSGGSPVWVWIVVDNVEAFKGNVENETRNWTAHERLYIQVKDLPNGTVSFDGKVILARVFAERKLLERAWEMKSSGTPAAIQPVPFPPSSTPNPSQTFTSTTTTTPSPTPTLTATAIPTNTPSPAPTLTLTATSIPTDTPSPIPTLTLSTTPSATAATTATKCPIQPGVPC